MAGFEVTTEDMQINTGEWITLRLIDVTAGDVYWMYHGNLKDASLLDLREIFHQIREQPIAAHSTVTGWIFCDFVTPLPPSGSVAEFNWQTRDTTGEKYEANTKLAPEQAQLDTSNLIRSQITLRTAHRDLSSEKITKKMWNDGH